MVMDQMTGSDSYPGTRFSMCHQV